MQPTNDEQADELIRSIYGFAITLLTRVLTKKMNDTIANKPSLFFAKLIALFLRYAVRSAAATFERLPEGTKHVIEGQFNTPDDVLNELNTHIPQFDQD